MEKRKGITLIALVVTIIVLLILVSITISFTLGSDGIIERTRNTKVDSRYGTIMDKVKTRETDLNIAFARKEEGEHQENFINRMIAEGLITADDGYDDITYRTIYIGKQSDGSYKYTIDIVDGTVEGQKIADAIDKLPDADAPGNEYLKNMTFIVRTTSANQTVGLSIGNTTGLTINWDVETNPTSFETPNEIKNPTYTYTSPGEYEVQIQGTALPNTNFGEIEFEPYSNIVEIKYWGENYFSIIGFLSNNLRGNIAVPSRNSFKKVTIFYQTFYYANQLTGSIPEGFFANCPNVTIFESTFYQCSSLTGSIPETLFANCPKVIEFRSIFSFCSNLTGSIPATLFANCPNVELFEFTFNSCSSLTGSIPVELFTNCKKVIIFGSTFANCSSLTESIPETLFANCPNVTSFESTFYGCSGLTGSIPAGLFNNCSEVTEFSQTFNYCSNLTGSIPVGLFENCPNVTSFWGTFSGCNKLTGNAPDLWNRIGVTGTQCFRNCTLLTNYLSIPIAWK